MSGSHISREIALRIGLAARELPDTDAARLLGVLDDLTGLPPTAEKLATVTVKELRAAADGVYAEVETAALKSALACLKGEAAMPAEQLPVAVPYSDGDMPGSIRVACASNSGELLDGHFGSCKRFLVYQVSESGSRLIGLRDIDDAAAGDDKNGYRASLIADCQILFVASIGGPAAAKVVRAGVHPVKKPDSGSARTEVEALQQVIGRGAPPWLAKVMGQTPEERMRFEQVGAEEASA